jgi:nicotinamidase-related amidase
MTEAAVRRTVLARYRREPRTGPVRGVEELLSFEPSEAALILVDVYPHEGSQAAIVRDAIVPVRRAARSAGVPVVYVTNELRDAHAASESRAVWLRALDEDVLETWRDPSPALEYLPEIAPDASDIVVRKPWYSGFYETRLDDVLSTLGVRDLFIAGFDARICVWSTATDALYRNFRVVVLRDAIGTTEHQGADGGRALDEAVRYFETCVGYTSTSLDFVDALAASS